MPRTLAAVVWIYRTALYLYPPGFRREFAGEMARDFEEATVEVWRATRWRGVLALWMHTGTDLATTAVVQWLRSGLPAIALASAAFAILSVSAAAQFPRVSIPTQLTEADRDVVTVLLLVVVVLMIVAAVLVFNLWFSRSLVRRLPAHRRF